LSVRDAQQSVHLIAATVGFLSYGLLWISVLWGIVLRNGWALTRMRHGTLYGIHQTVTLVALTLGVVHAVAQLATPGGTIRVIDQVVPFVNPVDPIGIGLGVIALELMIAIALSVLVQRLLGYHRWRRMHMLGYLAYVLLTLHLLISGSETTSIFVRIPIVLSMVLVFVASSGTRLATWWRARPRTGADPPAGDGVVSVDPSRCVRYGFCVQEAPALFRLQSDGRLNYRAAVAPELLEDAIRAAEACPARAVMVRQRGAGAAAPRSQVHRHPPPRPPRSTGPISPVPPRARPPVRRGPPVVPAPGMMPRRNHLERER
jgi:sulfoxide reductase heme-binding subunit YedZ